MSSSGGNRFVAKIRRRGLRMFGERDYEGGTVCRRATNVLLTRSVRIGHKSVTQLIMTMVSSPLLIKVLRCVCRHAQRTDCIPKIALLLRKTMRKTNLIAIALLFFVVRPVQGQDWFDAQSQWPQTLQASWLEPEQDDNPAWLDSDSRELTQRKR